MVSPFDPSPPSVNANKQKSIVHSVNLSEGLGTSIQRFPYRPHLFPEVCTLAISSKKFLAHLRFHIASLIQDLYLKELKAYKPSPAKNLDPAGQVQKFSPPKPPQPPNEGDVANELKEYESQQVEVEGQAAAGETNDVEVDWFEDDLEEEDEKAKDAH